MVLIFGELKWRKKLGFKRFPNELYILIKNCNKIQRQFKKITSS